MTFFPLGPFFFFFYSSSLCVQAEIINVKKKKEKKPPHKLNMNMNEISFRVKTEQSIAVAGVRAAGETLSMSFESLHSLSHSRDAAALRLWARR